MSDGINLDDLTSPSPSPIRPSRRRREQDDDEPQSESTVALRAASSNIVSGLKRYANSRGLKENQIVELENFLNDSPEGRAGRLFVGLFETRNYLDNIVLNQRPWTPSNDLKKNISSLVSVVLFSPGLSCYRGSIPQELVIERILSLGGTDLPPNIRSNSAALARLETFVETAITQLRSDIKKDLRASLMTMDSTKKWVWKKDSECTNIYELTVNALAGSPCKVSPDICARFAIFRRAYKEEQGRNFWVVVDQFIEVFRKKGKFQKDLIACVVAENLFKDRKRYGADNYTIENNAPTVLQADMAALLDARAASSGNAGLPEHSEQAEAIGSGSNSSDMPEEDSSTTVRD